MENKSTYLIRKIDEYFSQEKFLSLKSVFWDWRIDEMTISRDGILDIAEYFYDLGLNDKNKENKK